MDFSEVIDLFRQGVFDTDCREMVLTQNKTGGARFEGQGIFANPRAEPSTSRFTS
jgi:hypothetical protein